MTLITVIGLAAFGGIALWAFRLAGMPSSIGENESKVGVVSIHKGIVTKELSNANDAETFDLKKDIRVDSINNF
jgi:hypothetical protein